MGGIGVKGQGLEIVVGGEPRSGGGGTDKSLSDYRNKYASAEKPTKNVPMGSPGDYFMEKTKVGVKIIQKTPGDQSVLKIKTTTPNFSMLASQVGSPTYPVPSKSKI